MSHGKNDIDLLIESRIKTWINSNHSTGQNMHATGFTQIVRLQAKSATTGHKLKIDLTPKAKDLPWRVKGRKTSDITLRTPVPSSSFD